MVYGIWYMVYGTWCMVFKKGVPPSSRLFLSLASFVCSDSRNPKPLVEPSNIWNPNAREIAEKGTATRIHNRTTALPYCEVASHRNQPQALTRESITTNSLVHPTSPSMSVTRFVYPTVTGICVRYPWYACPVDLSVAAASFVHWASDILHVAAKPTESGNEQLCTRTCLDSLLAVKAL